MQVKFLHSISSVDGWSYAVGESADIPDAQAISLIEGGICEATDPRPIIEKAIAAPIETPETPKKRK